MMCATIEFIFLVTTLVFTCRRENNPFVLVEQGPIEGCYKSTWKGREFSAFRSIPYAKPPIGDLRFKAPEKAASWDGVLDGCQTSKICPQINIYFNDLTITGDEDCLYLNVYTPKLKKFAKGRQLPVMVFIHGGGFMNGHGNSDLYGPDILLDKDVVLVTINYRLGALGFLSLGNSEVPGNNGLKDQRLALMWIQENIDKFGGNPKKVTILGHSAGGASVHYHMLSPQSRDLFSGAIAHSGNAISLWAFGTLEEASRNSQKLGRLLNCQTDSKEALLDCLKNVKAYDIIAQDIKFHEWGYDPMGAFKPVVEVDNKDIFLSKDPIEIMKTGDVAQVPFITGFTIADTGIKVAAIYNSSILVKELNEEFLKVAPLVFQYKYKTDNPNPLSQKIKEFYFRNRDIDSSTRNEVMSMIGDAWTYFPQTYSILLLLTKTQQPIYTYLFAYNGSSSMASYFGDPGYKYGAVHGDDLIYLFSSDFFSIDKLTESDKRMIDLMTTLWTNFAETGNPTPGSRSWLPVESEAIEYCYIKSSNELKMEKNRHQKSYQFWKKILIDSL